MRLKIRCDGECEKFYKIFLELNKALVAIRSVHFWWPSCCSIPGDPELHRRARDGRGVPDAGDRLARRDRHEEGEGGVQGQVPQDGDQRRQRRHVRILQWHLAHSSRARVNHHGWMIDLYVGLRLVAWLFLVWLNKMPTQLLSENGDICPFGDNKTPDRWENQLINKSYGVSRVLLSSKLFFLCLYT